MGTKTTLGPLVQVELRPGLGGRRGGGEGVWAWEKKRETAAGIEYFAADAVHGTMHHAGSTWRCRVAVGEDVGDVGPALGPSSVRDSSTASSDPYLIACIDPVSPTSAEKESARGRRWINLILAVGFMYR